VAVARLHQHHIELQNGCKSVDKVSYQNTQTHTNTKGMINGRNVSS